MNKRKILNQIRERRQNRVRKKIRQLSHRIRLSLFRSNRHIYAQLIDDKNQKTLAAASSLEIKNQKLPKIKIAEKVGQLIAQKAKEIGVQKVVLDRKYYKYHGRVKALAEAAKKNGLII